jgi:hypothetical protein
VKRVILLVALASVAACSTSRSRFAVLGAAQPARPADCRVDVFLSGTPEREFLRISRIDVHIERTLWLQPTLNDALPELRRQACLSGADAVIDVRERYDAVVENRSYHVIGIGVSYRK